MPIIPTAEEQEADLGGRFAALFDVGAKDLESVFKGFSLTADILIDRRSLLPFAEQIITVTEQATSQHFGARKSQGYRDAYRTTMRVADKLEELKDAWGAAASALASSIVRRASA